MISKLPRKIGCYFNECWRLTYYLCRYRTIIFFLVTFKILIIWIFFLLHLFSRSWRYRGWWWIFILFLKFGTRKLTLLENLRFLGLIRRRVYLRSTFFTVKVTAFLIRRILTSFILGMRIKLLIQLILSINIWIICCF